jgi:glycosyltransferase involved in cell wall biosynthesis
VIGDGGVVVLCDTTGRAGSPRVSVAVSTRNRSGSVRDLIARLEGQSLPLDAFEVVIVDDASTDDTADVLRQLSERTPLALCALRLPARMGQSGGRNAAWRRARGPVIAFTDDDCTPISEWLERALSQLERSDVLVGRTMPDPKLEMGPFSRSIQRENADWTPTCNVFYWRDDLEAVHGFDEAYGALGCEDTDLGLRVRDQLGRNLAFGDDVLVYHDVRPSKFVPALKETQRWRSVARLFRAHPSARAWLTRRVFWHPAHPRVILAAIGIAFAPLFLPSLALVYPWYRLRTTYPWRLPGRLRQVYRALPGTFIIDLAETVAVVRGAIKYRTLVI